MTNLEWLMKFNQTKKDDENGYSFKKNEEQKTSTNWRIIFYFNQLSFSPDPFWKGINFGCCFTTFCSILKLKA